MNITTQFDIAIIGSGIIGSALGAILARHGLKVVIFEAKGHPRFSIGESMILETSDTMRAAAEFFDVPELAYFSSENFSAFAGTSHGIKRHFSYLYHTPGQPQDKQKVLQAIIPKEPHGHEMHLYRQDTDYFYMTTAIAYGATVLQQTPVKDVTINAEYVEIITNDDRKFTATYVVDASGFRSILANKFDLRAFDLKTHSRSIFTHMIDVPCYHHVSGSQQEYGLPFRVTEGTLHHVFDGGWLWVIPFDNHPKSTNPLCSVGLMLDPRIYPLRDDITPQEEFFSFINQFPSIKAQFTKAKPVRGWTRTGRIQYSSKRIVGNRYCLLGHAAGFIDPLYSKGLYISWMSMTVLAHLLLEAKTTGDYSAEAFQLLEKVTFDYIEAGDRLIANSFRSFGNYKLWSVYAVLWLMGAYTELLKLNSARVLSDNRPDYIAQLKGLRLVGGGFPQFKVIADVIDTIIENTNPKNEAEVDRAVAQIKGIMRQVDWMPPPFIELLNGKTYLPKNKVHLGLLKQNQGFMGKGDYRKHFFGDNSVIDLMGVFVHEKIKYSETVLKLRHRTVNNFERSSH